MTLIDAYNALMSDHFYSHARVGRDVQPGNHAFKRSYFYSHARVGRDDIPVEINRDAKISTHTPA